MINIEKLKVVELFSGIGTWSKALENLNINHEVVLAADNDDHPVTAYNAIHNSNFNPIDITKLNENDVPDCDIICYSPPCQSFSVAGKRLGFEDTMGVLFYDALRIIKHKQPKYALMENVKGLTQKKFENEFKIMLDELEKAGYRNYWKVLNAKDYDVAQNRERVFVISIRSDIKQEFEFPIELGLNKRIEDYLEDDATSPILHNIYGGFEETEARVFRDYSPTICTSAGGGHIPSVIIKGCSLRTRSYMGQEQQMEHRKDELSNTVTTVPKDFMVAILDDTYKDRDIREYYEYCPTIRSGRKGFKVVAKSNNQKFKMVKNADEITDEKEYALIREMSTLEAFRFMGYTDNDYEKVKKALNDTYHKGNDKSNTRLYKLAGNSIVVGVCEELFKNLLHR